MTTRPIVKLRTALIRFIPILGVIFLLAALPASGQAAQPLELRPAAALPQPVEPPVSSSTVVTQGTPPGWPSGLKGLLWSRTVAVSGLGSSGRNNYMSGLLLDDGGYVLSVWHPESGSLPASFTARHVDAITLGTEWEATARVVAWNGVSHLLLLKLREGWNAAGTAYPPLGVLSGDHPVEYIHSLSIRSNRWLRMGVSNWAVDAGVDVPQLTYGSELAPTVVGDSGMVGLDKNGNIAAVLVRTRADGSGSLSPFTQEVEAFLKRYWPMRNARRPPAPTPVVAPVQPRPPFPGPARPLAVQ